VWALGVTLFAMIFRKLPFFHNNGQKLQTLIGKGSFVIPSFPEISKELRNLLKGMLEKDFEKRLTIEDI